jgi:hypothetical protein
MSPFEKNIKWVGKHHSTQIYEVLLLLDWRLSAVPSVKNITNRY